MVAGARSGIGDVAGRIAGPRGGPAD